METPKPCEIIIVPDLVRMLVQCSLAMGYKVFIIEFCIVFYTGKFMQLHFNERFQIAGCLTEVLK